MHTQLSCHPAFIARRECRRPEALEARIAPAATVFDLDSLNGDNGFTISETTEAFAGLGRELAVGDFNGDGVDDLLVGAYQADGDLGGGNPITGKAYVIFGKTSGFTSPVTTGGAGVLTITNDLANGGDLGNAVAAGDLNGDGTDDIIVGDYAADANGNGSGAVYIIYGAPTLGPTIAVSTLNGTNGFRVVGGPNHGTGEAVAAADLNNDGKDDLIIGSPGANGYGGTVMNPLYRAGRVSILPGGGAFTATVDLGNLGALGFNINGPQVDPPPPSTGGYRLGEVLTDVGDINDDNFGDFAFTARTDETYVLFGASALSAPSDIRTITSAQGFVIEVTDFSTVGQNLSRGGDINGDGIDDLIVGDYRNDVEKAYIIFGRTTAFPDRLDPTTLNGTTGFTIQGGVDSGFGVAVTAAGDVDDDGFADLLIGAYGEDSINGDGTGAAYLLYGTDDAFAATVQLADLDPCDATRFIATTEGGSGGDGVALGDLNGDGFDDVIIGAYNGGMNGGGLVHVVFGGPRGEVDLLNDRTAQFKDVDGDVVTVKVNKGKLECHHFVLEPRGALGGAQLLQVDLSDPMFNGAKLSITAKTPKANADLNGVDPDGFVNVGHILATGNDLNKVTIDGDLGQIDAGNPTATKPAIKKLAAASLGTLGLKTQAAGTIDPLHSEINGDVKSVTIKGDVSAVFDVTGKLGKTKIGGDLSGFSPTGEAGVIRASSDIKEVLIKGSINSNAPVSGIISGGKLGKVTINGDLTSGDVNKRVIIAALGDPSATKQSKTVAIGSVTIKGNVQNARILAGYDTTLAPTNGDASIGKIVAGGDWAASDIVAGVADVTADGFGRNDAVVANTTPLISQIASITFKGVPIGSFTPDDMFGITAQRVAKLSVDGKKIGLRDDLDQFEVDEATDDFFLVELA